MIDEEYFESDEFKEILGEYETKSKDNVSFFMDLDDMADVADYYHLNGQADKAMEIVERALELYPGSTPPLVYKIHDAIFNGDINTAYGYLDQIEDKEDLEYTFIKGEILIADNRTEEADMLFRDRLRQIQPEQHQDYFIDVANIFTNNNVFDKGMEWSAKATPEDTDDFKELMARTMYGLGQYDESEKLFNELIDRHPYSTHYWSAIASTQYQKDDFSAAIDSSEYAIAIDPDNADALLTKANSLQQIDNYQEAVKFFERYIEKIPHDTYALLNLGICLLNQGKFYDSTKRFHQALDCTPSDSPYLPEIYQELGFAYSELRQPKTALYYLDKTDSLDCNHTEMMVVKGHVYLANGDIKTAERIFLDIIKKPDASPRALLRILVSLYDNKYVHAAYRMFERFYAMVGKDYPEGYSYLALCCWDLQRYDEFLESLRIAVERNPKEARLVLGPLFPQGMAPEEYYEYMKNNLEHLRT